MISVRESEVKTLLRGLLPYLIMKCVGTQALHGYELMKLLRRRFGVCFGPSTIYPLLKHLETKGLLRSHWETEMTKGVRRPRKVYIITHAGLGAVDALTLTIQDVSRFEGQIPQAPQKPERNNVIILEH